MVAKRDLIVRVPSPQMETDRREAKIAKEGKRLPARATSIHDLNDDLLELVLFGLDSPKWLLRAAATCKPWRRLVTAGAFLRRFRSLHAPPAVGTFYSINPDTSCSYGRGHFWPDVDPVYVPSSESASASGGPNGGPQLSVDFVPRSVNVWPRELVDGRGSLLLLLTEKDRPDRRDCQCCYHHADKMTPDLVVCEPLTRRYLAIPPLENSVCVLGAFLRDGTAGIGMENFRVLLVLYEHDLYGGGFFEDQHNGHGYPSASVFTNNGSNGGWWHHGETDYDGFYLPRLDQIHLAGRTGGRIYWGCYDQQAVMVLDEHTLKFSTMTLSEQMMNWQEFGRDNFRVIGGGGDGAVRIVHLAGGGELEVFGQAHGFHGTAHDWVLQMRVQLVEATRGLPGHKGKYFAQGIIIIDTQEGFVVLSPQEETWLFSVDLDTMELKREYGRQEYTGPAFLYTLPWPLVMRACVENGKKRRKRRRRKRRKGI